MGAEAHCDAVINGEKVRGKAKLETTTLEFRGPAVRIVAPFGELEDLRARDGILSATFGGLRLALSLGEAAERWREKIVNPPSRLKKLGVTPVARIAVLGDADAAFLGELSEALGTVSRRAGRHLDIVFVFLRGAADLDRLPALTASIAPDGAIWTVRPKGDKVLSERAVMAAGKAAGLVDVKVAAFSPTHTAEKFVIRKRDRPKS